jgi:hypothetical protein
MVKKHYSPLPFQDHGLYYKNITIIRITIVSDAPSCGITYDHHPDNIYAASVVNGTPIEHL